MLFVLAMRGHAWRAFRHNVYLDLAVIMLTMVMPFTAPFGHVILGWDAMAYSTRTDILRSALLVGIVTLLAVIIAYVWFAMRPAPVDEGDDAAPDVESRGDAITFGLWARLMAIFWTVEILFFTTFFTNTRNGLATGIVGSLGYWLKQQEVARGGQPWYYYIMLGGLYEFLPLCWPAPASRHRLLALARPALGPRARGRPAGCRHPETSVPGAPDTLAARYLDNRIYFVLGRTLGAVGLHHCGRKDALAHDAPGAAHVRGRRLVPGPPHPSGGLDRGVAGAHRLAHGADAGAALHPCHRAHDHAQLRPGAGRGRGRHPVAPRSGDPRRRRLPHVVAPACRRMARRRAPARAGRRGPAHAVDGALRLHAHLHQLRLRHRIGLRPRVARRQARAGRDRHDQ
ncbi:MAG: hypothetical protein R2854_03225 [Caldilineaceae bacterium]